MIKSISRCTVFNRKKNLRGSDEVGRQSRTGGTNPPYEAAQPLGERIHKLLVLSGRSRWWRSDNGNLLPRGLLGGSLTVLRLLIAMICIVRMPTQIGVCRIDGGLDVIAGDGTIYEVSKWGGSNGSDGAGAWVILVSIWRWVLQEGAERSKVLSEKVVVILDGADVHRVAVIFRMRADGPVRLCRK